MLICKHEEPEERQSPHALSPALSATNSSEDGEAQWEAYIAELARHQYGERAEGCDWTEGAMSYSGCRW